MAQSSNEEPKPASSASSSSKTSAERPRSKSTSHKRTTSGNILSRLPFFRTTPDASPTSQTADDTVPFPDVPDIDDDLSLPRTSALATALEAQGKGRKRKGSLRKAALLGTGRLRPDRRYSGADISKPRSQLAFPSLGKVPRKPSVSQASGKHEEAELPHAKVFIEAPPPIDRQSLKLNTQPPQVPSLLSPLTSPVGPYASTTDDDDGFGVSPTVDPLSIPMSKPSPSPSPPSSESSMTNGKLSHLLRRVSSKVASTSPLAIQSDMDSNEGWDYSATEWWGWIILLVTWIVFVVGMGSCLEVWSWAWDVGETPYAPPELEDDPTLPIVGYYPALMVLTAVMSWVWVVVAWIGMKYFKHARTHEFDAG